jgi:hypothetical protein
MGQQISDIGDDLDVENMHILVEYKSQKFSTVGEAFHIYATKYGYNCFLLNQDDFGEIFLPMWKKETVRYFDYFQLPAISALEAFAVAFALSDTTMIPLSKRLDALISLVQFKPVPPVVGPSFCHNEPNSNVDRDQVGCSILSSFFSFFNF